MSSWKNRLRGIPRIEQVLPLLHQVGDLDSWPLPGSFILLAAAPVKQRLFPGDLHLANFTGIRTALTFKGLDVVLPLGQVKALEARGLPGPLPPGQQRGAAGPGDIVVGWYRDGLSQHLLEGRHDAPVGGGGPLKKDGVADGPAFGHLVQIILHDGVRQPRDQVFPGRTSLLVVHEIRFHEHRAALSQAHRLCTGQGERAEFLPDGDPQLFRLLFQVRAGARGAHLVHHEIHNGTVP
jgi:hypothetical protein